MENNEILENLEKIKEIIKKIEKSIKKELTSDTLAVKRIEEILIKLEKKEKENTSEENIKKAMNIEHLEKLVIYLRETINNINEEEKKELLAAIEEIDEIKKKIKIKRKEVIMAKENLNFEKEYKVVINEEICKSCGICQKACPVGAIEGELREKRKVNNDICVKCKACIMSCPFKAIEFI